MLTDEKIKEFQEASDKLYESDIVYKTLVDNYCKYSIDSNSEKMAESINALAKYKEKLHYENVLALFKELNLTNEDLRDMAVQGILDGEVLKKIFKFKGWISDLD